MDGMVYSTRPGDVILSQDGTAVVGHWRTVLHMDGEQAVTFHFSPKPANPDEPPARIPVTIRVAFASGPVQIWKADTDLSRRHLNQALLSIPTWFDVEPTTPPEKMLDAINRVLAEGKLLEFFDPPVIEALMRARGYYMTVIERDRAK